MAGTHRCFFSFNCYKASSSRSVKAPHDKLNWVWTVLHNRHRWTITNYLTETKSFCSGQKIEFDPSFTHLLRLTNPAFRPFCDIGACAGAYSKLVAELKGTGLQANHLNQDAAFKSLIPQGKGVAVGMRGNAFTQIGTPHYEFHAGLEGFWTSYRRGGLFGGSRPTSAQYGAAVERALIRAGCSPQIMWGVQQSQSPEKQNPLLLVKVFTKRSRMHVAGAAILTWFRQR